MSIEQHISQLLYRYQCVTLPNFGAFLTETTSAYIQENNHTFFPPKKVLSFNSHIKNNDGLLANHIATAEKISYNEAVTKIESEVNQWLQKLQNRDFLILKNIGLLKYNAENNIVFESFNHTNYLSESFGLSSFVSPTVKREVLKTIVVDPAVQEKIEAEVVAIEPITRNPFITFIKYAAVITMTLGGGAFSYIGYINQQEKAETLMVQAEVQKELQSKIQEATFFISAPTKDEIINPELNYDFHIVAGSFRSKKNARKSMNILVRKGYNASILDRNETDLFSVIYGTYTSQAEADSVLATIQKKNKDAWVLLVEKK